MTPDVFIALELLSKAVWYAANDSEHAAWELKKLDYLLELIHAQRMTAREKELISLLRALVESKASGGASPGLPERAA